MTTPNDKTRTALLGQAIGDAFGAPFEYHKKAPRLACLSLDEERYLDSFVDVHQKPGRCRLAGLYTDDTQQALTLLLTRSVGGDKQASFFRETLRMMARGEGGKFGVHRGTGRNFRQAVTSGKPPDTAGLGACMRIGPAATMFTDPQEMIEWVIEVSSVTTSNPIALACAAKFATFAWVIAYPDKKSLISKIDWPDSIPSDVWKATTAALRIMRQEGAGALLDFAKMTGWANKEMRSPANGFALTGMPWAVYHGLTAPDFASAMRGVCSTGGDTDTVGAMAGCLAALRHGHNLIPPWMIEGLAARENIEKPEDWHPIRSEYEWTRDDEAYKKDLKVKVYKKRWKPTEQEELTLFDLAEEAYAEEDAAKQEPLEPVFFYGPRKGRYWPFSNFYAASFTLDDEEWPEVEHYYMAQKNPDDEGHQRDIRAAKTPGEAKALGREVRLQPGWDDLKFDVMLRAVYAKFSQNPKFAALLLSTGDRPIHEDCRDQWWGGGPNYPGGRDWLGQILMMVRKRLRDE